MSPEPQLRAATLDDADDVARIHLDSIRAAMPWLARPHTDEQVHEWTRGTLVPGGGVGVAEIDGAVVGYSWTQPGWLNGLYVGPGFQGRGVGSALFERAQRQLPDGFDLWVFQRNQRALDFYARYACREERRTDGARNEEREPDVLLHWGPATQRGTGIG